MLRSNPYIERLRGFAAEPSVAQHQGGVLVEVNRLGRFFAEDLILIFYSK